MSMKINRTCKQSAECFLVVVHIECGQSSFRQEKIIVSRSSLVLSDVAKILLAGSTENTSCKCIFTVEQGNLLKKLA